MTSVSGFSFHAGAEGGVDDLDFLDVLLPVDRQVRVLARRGALDDGAVVPSASPAPESARLAVPSEEEPDEKLFLTIRDQRPKGMLM